jgi:hypothetical protein
MLSREDGMVMLKVIGEWITERRYILGWERGHRLADKARCVVTCDRVLNKETSRVEELQEDSGSQPTQKGGAA